MADNFASNTKGLSSPADRAVEVTPHNSNLLDPIPRSLFIGGDGDLDVVTNGGDTVTFTGCVAGTILPVRAKLVLTSTTATNIVALS